jgi:hypothetical protein
MDSNRVDAIYEQIGKFSVELPSDAWALGPKHIHELISLTRGYTNSVSHLLQEILQERQLLDRSKHAAEAVFQIDSDRLLAEDDRVRRLPNIDDRKAVVHLILRERMTEIQTLQGQLLDLSYVEKAVRHRYNELKSTMSDIRAQRALIRDAIDTGSFYGDETVTPRGSTFSSSSAPSDGGFSEADIDKSMAEIDDMLVAGVETPPDVPVVTEPPPPEPVPLPVKKAVFDEDDFSDLIDGVVSIEELLPTTPATNGAPVDPDLARFLDGDDLSNLFDEDTQSV